MIEPPSENDHQNIILIENESQKNTLDNKLEELKILEELKNLEDNNKKIPNNKNKNNNEKIIRVDSFGQEISKKTKKHKVSFIDQVQSKKDFAQIIYINDQSSLEDDNIDVNKYLDILRKKSTNVSEYFRRENQERNETETYKIKRPKNSKFKKRRTKTKDKIDEQCNCIIF